jgi:glycosyltransferase involved in cell wall biosynthesis
MVQKILLLAENPYFGGINAHLLAVLDAFRDHEDFTLVPASLPGLKDDTTFLDAAEALGYAVHVFPMAHRFDVRAVKAMKQFLADEDIALIHTHGYRGGLVTSMAAGGIPVVSTSHGQAVAPALRTKLWQFALVRSMKGHRLSIAVSDHVRRWLVSQGLPEDRVVTVHNGFHPPDAIAAEPSRSTLAISDETCVFLFCGRLVEGKGIAHFLEALEDLPNAQGLVVGDGPLRPALEAQAAKVGTPIHFAGQTDDPWPYYRIADAIVLPSEMEALPSVLIEAASQGLPAVASDRGGVPEIVVDGETGLIVPYGAVAELHDAMAKLGEASLRTAIGAKAHERWKENFAPEVMAEGLSTAYRRALRGGS